MNNSIQSVKVVFRVEVQEVSLCTEDVLPGEVISICFERAGKFVSSREIVVPSFSTNSKTISISVNETLSLMSTMMRPQSQGFFLSKNAKLIVRQHLKHNDGTEKHNGIGMTNIALHAISGQYERQLLNLPMTHCSRGASIKFWITPVFSAPVQSSSGETDQTDHSDTQSVVSWQSDDDVLAADFDSNGPSDGELLSLSKGDKIQPRMESSRVAADVFEGSTLDSYFPNRSHISMETYTGVPVENLQSKITQLQEQLNNEILTRHHCEEEYERIARILSDHSDAITSSDSYYQDTINKLETSNQALAAELYQTQEEKLSVIKELEDSQTNLTEQLNRIQQQNADLQERNVELESTLEYDKNNHLETIGGLSALLEERSSAHADLERQLEATRQELISELEAAKQQHKSELDSTKDQLISELEATRQQLISELEAAKQQHKSELDSTKHLHTSHLDSTKQQLISELEATRQQHISELDSTKQQHKLEVQQLIAHHESQLIDAVARSVDQANKQYHEMKIRAQDRDTLYGRCTELTTLVEELEHQVNAFRVVGDKLNIIAEKDAHLSRITSQISKLVLSKNDSRVLLTEGEALKAQLLSDVSSLQKERDSEMDALVRGLSFYPSNDTVELDDASSSRDVVSGSVSIVRSENDFTSTLAVGLHALALRLVDKDRQMSVLQQTVPAALGLRDEALEDLEEASSLNTVKNRVAIIDLQTEVQKLKVDLDTAIAENQHNMILLSEKEKSFLMLKEEHALLKDEQTSGIQKFVALIAEKDTVLKSLCEKYVNCPSEREVEQLLSNSAELEKRLACSENRVTLLELEKESMLTQLDQRVQRISELEKQYALIEAESISNKANVETLVTTRIGNLHSEARMRIEEAECRQRMAEAECESKVRRLEAEFAAALARSEDADERINALQTAAISITAMVRTAGSSTKNSSEDETRGKTSSDAPAKKSLSAAVAAGNIYLLQEVARLKKQLAESHSTEGLDEGAYSVEQYSEDLTESREVLAEALAAATVLRVDAADEAKAFETMSDKSQTSAFTPVRREVMEAVCTEFLSTPGAHAFHAANALLTADENRSDRNKASQESREVGGVVLNEAQDAQDEDFENECDDFTHLRDDRFNASPEWVSLPSSELTAISSPDMNKTWRSLSDVSTSSVVENERLSDSSRVDVHPSPSHPYHTPLVPPSDPVYVDVPFSHAFVAGRVCEEEVRNGIDRDEPEILSEFHTVEGILSFLPGSQRNSRPNSRSSRIDDLGSIRSADRDDVSTEAISLLKPSGFGFKPIVTADESGFPPSEPISPSAAPSATLIGVAVLSPQYRAFNNLSPEPHLESNPTLEKRYQAELKLVRMHTAEMERKLRELLNQTEATATTLRQTQSAERETMLKLRESEGNSIRLQTENSRLLDRLVHSSREIATLQQQLGNREDLDIREKDVSLQAQNLEISKLQSERTKLLEDLSANSKHIGALEMELSRLKLTISMTEETREFAQQEFFQKWQDSEAKLIECQRQLAVLESAQAMQQETYTKLLLSEHNNMDHTEQLLREHVKELQERIVASEGVVTVLKGECTALSSQVTVLTSKLSTAEQELQQARNDKVSTLAIDRFDAVEQTRKEIGEISKERDSLRAALVEARAARDMAFERATSKFQLPIPPVDTLASGGIKVSALYSQVKSIHKQNQILQSRLSTQNTEIDGLNLKLHNSQEDVDTLAKETVVLRHNCSSLKEALDSITSQRDELVVKLSQQQVANNKREADSLRASLRDAQDDRDMFSRDVVCLRRDLALLKTTLAETEAERDGMARRLASSKAEAEELQRQLVHMNSRSRLAATDSLHSKGTQRSSVLATTAGSAAGMASSELLALKHELTCKENEVQDLQETIHKQVSQIESLNSQLLDIRREVADINIERWKEARALGVSAMTTAQVNSQIPSHGDTDSLQRQISVLTKEVFDAKEALQNKIVRNIELQRQVDDTTAQDELTRQLSSARKELSEVRSELAKKDVKVADLLKQIDEMTLELVMLKGAASRAGLAPRHSSPSRHSYKNNNNNQSPTSHTASAYTSVYTQRPSEYSQGDGNDSRESSVIVPTRSSPERYFPTNEGLLQAQLFEAQQKLALISSQLQSQYSVVMPEAIKHGLHGSVEYKKKFSKFLNAQNKTHIGPTYFKIPPYDPIDPLITTREDLSKAMYVGKNFPTLNLPDPLPKRSVAPAPVPVPLPISRAETTAPHPPILPARPQATQLAQHSTATHNFSSTPGLEINRNPSQPSRNAPKVTTNVGVSKFAGMGQKGTSGPEPKLTASNLAKVASSMGSAAGGGYIAGVQTGARLGAGSAGRYGAGAGLGGT